MPTILFNGKTYNSIEEMPVDVRSAYQQVADIFVDKNGNGIPDFLEGDMVKNVITAFTSNVNVNGQTYNNMNELPPDICAQVQGAFEKLSALGMVTNNNSPSIPQAARSTTYCTIAAPRLTAIRFCYSRGKKLKRDYLGHPRTGVGFVPSGRCSRGFLLFE